MALLVVAVVVPVASFLASLPGPHFDLHPGWGALLAVTLALTLLAFDLGAIALLVGALTGKRGSALGIAGGIGAASYLVSSLAPGVDGIRAVRWLSPFYWAVGDDQLLRGVSVADLSALVGLGVVLLVATRAAFYRLDIH